MKSLSARQVFITIMQSASRRLTSKLLGDLITMNIMLEKWMRNNEV
jgi:hypothetical protein